jgi:hypothetical protein
VTPAFAAKSGRRSPTVTSGRSRGACVLGTAGPVNHEFLAGLGAEPPTYGPGLTERAGTAIDAAIDVAARGSLGRRDVAPDVELRAAVRVVALLDGEDSEDAEGAAVHPRPARRRRLACAPAGRPA